ncbi:MAG TPA: LuxR C-terminal-related transcriptional regulator [Kofleriaceae bacterium]|nr:LuxR C-terminal-related transcriptional regulator [Kofleriaceae bacterium]
MTSRRLLELLDRFYDLDVDDVGWLRGIGETIRPIVDCGAGVNVWTVTADPASEYRGLRIGVGHDIDVMWEQFTRVVPVQLVVDHLLTTPITNVARQAPPELQDYVIAGHAAMGVRSLTSINAGFVENTAVCIGVPIPHGGPEFWPVHDRGPWERISAHLAAAYRLRARRALRERPVAIMSATGGVLHAEPEASAGSELAQLRDAMAVVDRARRVHMAPEAVLDAWRALYHGRWSIVESIERDGRRLLIAHPNAPLHDDAAAVSGGDHDRTNEGRTLSAAERRVVAAVAQGHSNKLIAYELGIAISTVATLIGRARRKLGCSSRVELVRTGRALLPPRAGGTTTRGRA